MTEPTPHICTGVIVADGDVFFRCPIPGCGYEVQYYFDEKRQRTRRRMIRRGADPYIGHSGSVDLAGLVLGVEAEMRGYDPAS